MSVTLVTPTFERDYERFAFQRESLERTGTDLPHLAIVDTEDMPRFRDLPFQRNLTLVPSSAVLGATMDRRRQAFGISRRNWRYWVTGRGVHGWMAQQLMKLAAANLVQTPAMVCLDSDTCFVHRVTAEDFIHADGRLHLYETTDDLDVEMAEWYAHSLRFLGVRETGITPRRFTHSPVPMHVELVRDMQCHIERLHGLNWMEAMVGADRITEYATYGTFARHLDQCRQVAPVAPGLTLYFWWKQEAAHLAEDFQTRLAASAAKMVLINSNIGIPLEQYRALIARYWNIAPEARPAEMAEVPA